MSINNQDLYQRIVALISSMPDLEGKPATPDVLKFLGQADALVNRVGDQFVTTDFRFSMERLLATGSPQEGQKVILALYRAMYRAELLTPASAQGTFIPASNIFDAMVAVGKVLRTAQREILLLDSYMDATILSDFVVSASDSVKIQLLVEDGKVKSTLKPALQRWHQQYPKRSLICKLANAGQLHDRAIFIDKQIVYSVSQSFNGLAKNSPATIQKLDAEIALLKMSAYDQIWQNANVF